MKLPHGCCHACRSRFQWKPSWANCWRISAAGGGANELQDGAPEPMAQLAIGATHAVGLSLAAVDLFDLGESLAVIEVNSNPMIATLEEGGRWDLIAEIWSANIEAALR